MMTRRTTLAYVTLATGLLAALLFLSIIAPRWLATQPAGEATAGPMAGAPGTRKIHARLFYVADDGLRLVSTALTASKLVRVAGAVPERRPDITPGSGANSFVGYVRCNADGDDGDPLCDYDVIGSQALRQGLFALEGQAFNFLYIPPLARERDLGMSTLVVATRFCRRHHALLLVDPPAAWADADTALAGLAHWPFHSADALMFFPRIDTVDRLKGRSGLFASGGAAAGLVARADRAGPHWWSTDAVDLPLRPSLRMACAVDGAVRAPLAARGVNLFCSTRSALREPQPARTLGGDFMRHGEPRTLLTRRLLLWIAASVERGTRWVTLERNDVTLRARASTLVLGLLEDLAAQGALAAAGLGGSVFVVCDERLNGELQIASGEFNLLYGIDAQRAGDHDAWLVTHRAGGSQTRAVSVNEYALRSRA